MASLLRYTAVAALASSVSGFAIGAIPTQTLAGGYGQAFLQPTAAPSVKLVKQKLKGRALTNVCTEWTIPGGYGQPQCDNSQTCLFQTVNGRLYEGCGQTSIAYDWITQCWNYPQSGVPPKSEIFCPAEEPYCGFFGFDFGSGYTAYNFGCSTASYGLIVSRIETDGFNSSDTTITDDFLATPDPTATETSVPSTPTIFVVPGSGSDSTSTPSSSPRPTPTPNKHSKTPIGAIVGGAVGGVAVLALLAFLLWFCLRKRKQKRAESAAAHARIQNEQASALTAYGLNNNNVAEIGGTMKPAAAYGGVPLQQQQQHPAMGVYPEKQTAGMGTQEVYRPPMVGGHLSSSSYGENTNTQTSMNTYPTSQSPPPVYTNPSSTLIPSPPSQYSELAQDQTQNGRRASNLSSQGAVSPMGSGFSPPPGQSQSPMRMQSPPPAVAGVGELGTNNEVNELGGENRGSWNVPPGVQEMGGHSSSGGIARRPVGGSVERRSQVDMNGMPISEEFRHELQ
ncbi:hypothetical protein DL98DRAFT_649817 [Cadophora sp. DSE1049]|nr:hypothetical protein DL98DRAFT_649817 [Cadophora sp. DSE1049]